MIEDPIIRLNAALVGRYRIEREIGEGGMATVYLAHDERHNRNVALKVLKAELATVVGAERFLAEIETTAKLTHPHILPLFDSGEADGFLFFVTPYIEGDTLRDKIEREKQLPVKEALEITKRVASALDYAHNHGVVHRDIKPGNILLSAEGEPTVADFGIALAVAQAGGGRITETGLSLGTPHYMSPEQATGDRDVDPRTDVYALGCVLYEMLVGDPPYTGASAQAVLAKILTDDAPDPTKVRVSIPPNVDAAVRKSLEKLPADRFTSAQDFARALSNSAFRHGEAEVMAWAATSSRWRTLAIGTSCALGILALWAWLRPSTPEASTTVVQRTVIPLPPGQQLSIPHGQAIPFALSPDGSVLVYAGVREGRTSLYLRPLDSFESTELVGTVGARQPFFSWDGTQIGFFANHQLQRVPVDGGAPFQITEVQGLLAGASWGQNDTIVYSTGRKLLKVRAAGGEPVPLELQVAAVRDAGVSVGSGAWPHHLPDGEHLLVSLNQTTTVVASLASGELTPAVDGRQGQYLPGGPSSGHIVYMEPGERVRAVAFDLVSLRVTGEPFPLFESVFRGPKAVGASFRSHAPDPRSTSKGGSSVHWCWSSDPGGRSF